MADKKHIIKTAKQIKAVERAANATIDKQRAKKTTWKAIPSDKPAPKPVVKKKKAAKKKPAQPQEPKRRGRPFGRKPRIRVKPNKKQKKVARKVAIAINPEGGRPVEYITEFNETARKMCLLGYTDKELAFFFGVAEETLNNWKITHSKFLQSIKAGREIADAQVVDRLWQRALGYEHDSEEIKVVSDGTGLGSSIERVPVRKVYPPSEVAAKFFLMNRQRGRWTEKIETGFTDKEGNDRTVEIIQLPDNGRPRAAAQKDTTEDNSAATRLPDEGAELVG